MICLLTGFTFFDVMSGAAMPARGGCLALLPHGVLDVCSSGAAIDRWLKIGIPRARLETSPPVKAICSVYQSAPPFPMRP
jgi:hypothetical protein